MNGPVGFSMAQVTWPNWTLFLGGLRKLTAGTPRMEVLEDDVPFQIGWIFRFLHPQFSRDCSFVEILDLFFCFSPILLEKNLRHMFPFSKLLLRSVLRSVWLRFKTQAHIHRPCSGDNGECVCSWKNISAIDLMQANVGKYALLKKNRLSCFFPLQMFRFEEFLRKNDDFIIPIS